MFWKMVSYFDLMKIAACPTCYKLQQRKALNYLIPTICLNFVLEKILDMEGFWI